ncbi:MULTISPECIES: hypothetical protein [Pyrobaculum]|nr:hypothetical protein [Pyrobaculum arsenaticum]ABP50226.1 conserved hypothetical protein [Pyrobaculum arsenaticum DSM 13514]MCY0889879.1 hypothetical protein [Pyrobaculum arsenaticum]NYR14837.1 hypothetical protein [Pyrobaculum arsenaticum]
MKSAAEKLGPLAKLLEDLGINPYAPANLILARLFIIAPKLARRLADAS